MFDFCVITDPTFKMGHGVRGAFFTNKDPWFTTLRIKYMFLVASFCSTSFFLILISRANYIMFYHSIYGMDNVQSKKWSPKIEGCIIPSLDPLDESIKKFVKKPVVPLCLEPEMLPLDHNQTHIWVKNQFREQNKTLDNETLSCCYRAFFRPAAIDDIDKNVDNRVSFEKCKNFTDIIDVRHEFVKVTCNLFNSSIQQYFLFAKKKKFMSHDNGREILKNVSAYNVLVLGIDAVSRLNFYRTMPKTIQYLKDKGAVDLSSYNKVGDNTFPNLIPMLMGISVEELSTTCLPNKKAKFDNCPFLWEWFKQAGYYTALGEDSSWLGTFNYLRAGFSATPTDYYLHTFVNEAEHYTRKVPHFDFNSTSFCVNDKYFYKILLDYIENLTVTLATTKLFGFFWEITMSHDKLNYPMVMDDDYVNFFEKLEKSNYLNDTIIFLVSDHGIRWGGIRYTKQGRLEERLPFVFILTPQSFRINYSQAFKNLQLNSNRLATPYDLHATLFDLTNLQNVKNDNILSRSKESYGSKRSISLFLPIPSNRTCEMAGITDHWCTCHKGFSIAKNSEEASKAAGYLVKYLNDLLKDYRKCATLKVVEVMEATEMVVGTPNKGESGIWREFLVTVKTAPGGGVFEATLRNSTSSRWSVSGTVSRLNLYGQQSACVEDNLLKLYCYCI